jgi:hypothetical protein
MRSEPGESAPLTAADGVDYSTSRKASPGVKANPAGPELMSADLPADLNPSPSLRTDTTICGLKVWKCTVMSSFFATLAFGISLSGSYLAPFFPALANSVGVSTVHVGIIFAVEPLASLCVTCLASMWLLTRFSPIYMLYASSAIAGVATLTGMLITLRMSAKHLVAFGLAIRAVSAVGAVMGMAAILALLYSNVPSHALADAVGINEAAIGFAVLVGPLLGGVTPVAVGQVPCWPFIFTGGLILAACIPFLLLPQRKSSSTDAAGPQGLGSLLHALWSVPDLRRGALFNAVTMAGIVAVDPVLGPLLNAAPFAYTNTQVALFYFWGAVAYAAGTVLFSPALQRRFGLHLTLASAAMVAAAGSLGLAHIQLVAKSGAHGAVAIACAYVSMAVDLGGSGVITSACAPLMLNAARDPGRSLPQPDALVASVVVVTSSVGALTGFVIGAVGAEAFHGDFRVLAIFSVLQLLALLSLGCTTCWPCCCSRTGEQQQQ